MSALKNNVSKKADLENLPLTEQVENFTNCCLCGTDLEFTHSVDYGNLAIKEEAFCPACSIKTKSAIFTLQ